VGPKAPDQKQPGREPLRLFPPHDPVSGPNTHNCSKIDGMEKGDVGKKGRGGWGGGGRGGRGGKGKGDKGEKIGHIHTHALTLRSFFGIS
jgi:hypothetical protein